MCMPRNQKSWQNTSDLAVYYRCLCAGHLASISVSPRFPAAGEWAARAVVTVNSGARKWLESQLVPRAEVDSQFTPDRAVSDLQLALTNVSATAREAEETKAR